MADSATVAAGQVRGNHLDDGSPAAAVPIRPRPNRLWAELMQRSFGFDVLACPRCGNRLELIALIENPPVIRRILDHLGLPTEVPAARPAAAPDRAIRSAIRQRHCGALSPFRQTDLTLRAGPDRALRMSVRSARVARRKFRRAWISAR